MKCAATADNVRGPFYRANAPFRQNRLCSPSEPGSPLALTGLVTGAPECVPLPNAVLDVWQANAHGLYSNMLGLRRETDSKAFRLRGRFRTDSKGHYRIETILPGHYPWPLIRARHIHFVLTCPGFNDLVTQIFFAGDPRLSKDPWVKPSLIVELGEEQSAGKSHHTVTFDFVLKR